VSRIHALVVAAILAGCTSTPRAVPDSASLAGSEVEAYREAESELESGDATAALRTIAAAAEREPWHVPSHTLRQDALVALGQEAEARVWYAEEETRHPEDAARVLLSARLASRTAGARESGYRAALKLDPSSPWARIALAYELDRVAEDERTRATALADGGFRADADAARARSKTARAEAVALAEKAVADRPDLAATQGALADVLLSRGLGPGDPATATAVKAAETAANIDSGSAAAWNRVGRARRARSDDAGAAIAFGRACDIAPEEAVFKANLGRVLLDLRRDVAARDTLSQAAKLAPGDEAVAVNYGVALFRNGRLKAAENEFERASRLAPSDPRPFEGMALARGELGDREGAADAMEGYLAAGGTDRDSALRFIDSMRAPAKQ
jgi:tetratricopeptide (TPR) repeat protein